MIRKFCCGISTPKIIFTANSIYLLNYFAGLLGIPLKGVFHHSSSKSVFILLYQYVKDLKCKIQILFENYNINIELNFNISNFCKKNFKKFLHQFVGSPGLEPRMQGPKSCVLPLHHNPIYKKSSTILL